MSNQTIEAVLSFQNAPTWTDAKKVAETHHDLLLSDEANAVFASLLEQYQGDEAKAQSLDTHRLLIADCRRDGIDSAFAPLVHPIVTTHPLPQALFAYLEAQSWIEAKGVVETHRDLLLTAAADVILESFLRAGPKDTRETRLVKEHRLLLARCRRDGIDAAFANKLEEIAIEDALYAAVLAFVNAPTHDETKQVFESQRELLLTAAADNLLNELTKQYRGDDDAMRQLNERRVLLGRSRRDGIDAAFAECPVTEDLATLLAEAQRLARQSKFSASAAAYRLALTQVDQRKHPDYWGTFLCELGEVLVKDPGGNRAENIDEAIRCYRSALKVYTRSALPDEWARIQFNLGLTYFRRFSGERAENLEEAIRCYRRAREVWTQATFPAEWADIQFHIGIAYFDRVREERAANLEASIRCYRQALKVWSYEAFPHVWAMTHYNLGSAYLERIRGKREENVKAAILHSERALEVLAPETSPDVWARAQLNLGIAWFDGARGERAENQESAILHFQQALEILTPQTLPAQYAVAEYSLGAAFAKRIRGEREENQDAAILHSERALEILTPQTFPEDWARTHFNLARTYQERIGGAHADNLEFAINHYRLALVVWSRAAAPEKWSRIQVNLGDAHATRVLGDHADYADNIEEAIRCYRQALVTWTREAFPGDWAATQHALGVVYWLRQRGERGENIEEAIRCYRRAQEVWTSGSFPYGWGMSYHNLGTAYLARIRGKRTMNLEEAIRCFRLALEAWTREAFPEEWAKSQQGLNEAHGERVREAVSALVNMPTLADAIDTIEANHTFLFNEAAQEILDELIQEYASDEDARRELVNYRELLLRNRHQGLQVVEHSQLRPFEQCVREFYRLIRRHEFPRAIAVGYEALAQVNRDELPLDWASLHGDLGNAYAQNDHGSRVENVETAIGHYRNSLKVFTREMYPSNWAATQKNLGMAYARRIRGDRGANLEAAIRRYRKALSVRTRQTFPAEWAETQSVLGNAYFRRVRGDRAKNLEEAIRCHRRALEVRTREPFPEDWAKSQYGLGEAHRERIRGHRAENVEEAIRCYHKALEVWTRDAFPKDWAMTQNALGAANLDRVRGDRGDNLEEAIRCCQRALEAHTRDAFPEEWAMAQHNLGTANFYRLRGERVLNIEEAIRRYHRALSIRTRETFPAEWAETQNALGKAYLDRVRGDRAKNLEEAIRCYRRTLEVWTREAFPERWAIGLSNLGVSLKERSQESPGSYREDAIDCYLQALEVWTREAIPDRWAMVHHNLGNAYSDRGPGDQPLNLEEAICCYRRALEVWTPKESAEHCLMTCKILGAVLHHERRFPEARPVLCMGHEAIEALRGEARRDATRRALATENADLYARLVHCCVEDGDEEAAFSYAIAAKGRAFVDLLGSSRFDLAAAVADDPALAADIQRLRDIRRQIDMLLARVTGEGAARESAVDHGVASRISDELHTLQIEESTLWDDLTFRHPALTATQQAPALNSKQARALAEELKATVVEYYRHAGEWCAFVVTRDRVRLVPLPDVDNLTRSAEVHFKTIESPRWHTTRDFDRLHWWYSALIEPLRPHLPPPDLNEKVIFAPFSWLHLLPIAAAFDLSEGRYASSQWTVSFAPSLSALRVQVDQRRREAAPSEGSSGQDLLSIAYPGRRRSKHYLKNVLPEAKAISRYFSQVTTLHQNAATPAAVVAIAPGHEVVHVGAHAHFDFAEPERAGLMLHNGWLTLRQVLTELDLTGTRLATIAACLLGRTLPRQGDEPVGYVQALLTAGAREVVAALWSVPDAATRVLFEAFYAVYGQGHAPAVALAIATEFIRKHQKWAHPYYWAAFHISGLPQDAASTESDAPMIPPDVRRRAKRLHDATARGSQSMSPPEGRDLHSLVEDTCLLLLMLTERPRKIASGSNPGDERLAAALAGLAEQVARHQTSSDCLSTVDLVFRLFEDTPALRQLLPSGHDIATERHQRTILAADYQSSEVETANLQDLIAALQNAMNDARDQYVKIIQRDTAQTADATSATDDR